MSEDPIVAEVRRIREEYAAQFNYDLRAIFKDLKEQQENSGRTYVSFPARRVQPAAVPRSAAQGGSSSQSR